MKCFLIPLIFLLFFYSCQKDVNVPNEFIPVFEYLDDHMSKSDLTELLSHKEKGFPPYYYKLNIQDDIQTKLNNNISFWSMSNSYLDSLGVENSIDKYGIIMNMYQDYLNELKLNIDEEIKRIDNYWSPVLTCESILKKQAHYYLDTFNVNDVIIIQMPVDEHENAVDYECPEIDWSFIEDHDLELKAVIKEKKHLKDVAQNSFTAEVIEMSQEYTIHYKEVREGDVIIIPAKTAWKLKRGKNEIIQ